METSDKATVDRDSPRPYYLQIADILGRRIRTGFYRRNEFLPTEPLLATEFGVTRVTVRSAMNLLVEQGIVQTERGRGNRVISTGIELSLLRFYSFGREFRNRGIPISSRVISQERGRITRDVAARLECSPLTFAVTIERLRSVDDRPFILELSWVPSRMAPGLERIHIGDASIYDLLESRYSVFVERALESIRPEIAGGPVASALKIPEGSPVFFTERVCRDRFGAAVEFRRSYIRGDTLTFTTELR